MPTPGQNYIIAGAGIAGLTLALALAKFGASVTVLERNETLQEFGAGLQVSPNARHVLNDLGLDEALTAVSHEPEALDTYAPGGERPIVSLELGGLMRQRFGSPYAVMHRADLANVLYRSTRRFANIDILFGVRDFQVLSHERGVEVTFEDSAGSRKARALAFIGADGVHSTTRRTFLAGPNARYGHRIAWRALVSADRLAGLIDLKRVSVFFGRGFHLVCYPLPHRGQVNLALFLPSQQVDAQDFPPRPAGTGRRAGEILDAAAGLWAAWPLYTVETDRWSEGKIGLMGDAAHAMVPFQAQGAAMGIEDAAVLAPLLVNAPSIEEGFARYAALRQARVRKVVALSLRNGRIFHLSGPAALARNTVMRLGGPQAHLKRLGWIYDYKATPAASGPA